MLFGGRAHRCTQPAEVLPGNHCTALRTASEAEKRLHALRVYTTPCFFSLATGCNIEPRCCTAPYENVRRTEKNGRGALEYVTLGLGAFGPEPFEPAFGPGVSGFQGSPAIVEVGGLQALRVPGGLRGPPRLSDRKSPTARNMFQGPSATFDVGVLQASRSNLICWT